jgi:hypothetical protein
VSGRRPDRARRITPELMDYHKTNARRLRTEACADARRMLRVWLRKLIPGRNASTR